MNHFMRDLVNNTVNSRSDSDGVQVYARSLSTVEGVTAERNDPVLLHASGTKKKKSKKPREPHEPRHIAHNADLAQHIQSIPSYKLERLYYSIGSLRVAEHTPLLCVGIWSFIETLTSLCGRNSGVSFEAFLSKHRLTALGFVDRETQTSLKLVVERVLDAGNMTKHHNTSAVFNGQQLVNDMETLTPLLIKLAESARIGSESKDRE